PSMGMTPVAGIGGVSGGSALSGMASVAEQHSIEPGSAVSAVLVRGDLQIAATCTVTYVDPTQLLACGHPITQYGPVSFPMTKTDVVATLPSPLNAFKIVNTGDTIGSFTEDRQTAIRGQFGLAARMIPLTVHIAEHGAAPRTLHLQVVDQEQVTPAAVLVSIYQGLMESNAYAAETSYRVRGEVALKGYPAMRLDWMVAPTDMAPSNLAAAIAVGQRFQRLYDNAARNTPVESIDINVEALAGRRSMQLVNAQAEKREVRGGDTVLIDASVRPWRAGIRNIRIPVKLPATLPSGTVRLLVSNGEALDRLMQPPVAGAPQQDVAATIAGLNNLHASDRLYVTLLAPEAQAALDGRTLAALPLSMANVLEPERRNHRVALNGESAVPLGSVELGSVLEGDQVITLHVE
ncbi:MAG: SpoIVB peptidase S55, partial [Acidobacteriaceae bacterium]